MAITIDGTGNITGLVAGGLPDLSITNADLASDAVSTSKLLNAAVTTAKLGSSEASGLAKAFVNFNGTGTVAIRASFNVSSITDNGVGDYTVNFTTALVDANYSAILATNRFSDGTCYDPMLVDGTMAAGSCRLNTRQSSSWGLTDREIVCVAIFR
jgi:hypothetical protein